MYDRILIPVTARSFSREIDPSFANQLKHLIQAGTMPCQGNTRKNKNLV